VAGKEMARAGRRLAAESEHGKSLHKAGFSNQPNMELELDQTVG